MKINHKKLKHVFIYKLYLTFDIILIFLKIKIEIVFVLDPIQSNPTRLKLTDPINVSPGGTHKTT